MSRALGAACAQRRSRLHPWSPARQPPTASHSSGALEPPQPAHRSNNSMSSTACSVAGNFPGTLNMGTTALLHKRRAQRHRQADRQSEKPARLQAGSRNCLQVGHRHLLPVVESLKVSTQAGQRSHAPAGCCWIAEVWRRPPRHWLCLLPASCCQQAPSEFTCMSTSDTPLFMYQI